MIETTSIDPPYAAHFSDGEHMGIADTTEDKGGSQSGFRPHDLLEAAFACCLNMTVRMYADSHTIPLQEVRTKVTLDRETNPEEAIFRYEIILEGDLTEEERTKLLSAARACPIKKTLSRKISFASVE